MRFVLAGLATAAVCFGCGSENGARVLQEDLPRVMPAQGVWGAELSCVFPEGARRRCLVEVVVGNGEGAEEHDATLNYRREDGQVDFVQVHVRRVGSSLEVSSRNHFEGDHHQTFFAGDFVSPVGGAPRLQNHSFEVFTLLPFSPFNGATTSEARDCVLGETAQGWKRVRVSDAAQCQAAQWAFRELSLRSDVKAQFLDLKGFAPKSESALVRETEVVFAYNSPVTNSRLYLVKARQQRHSSGSTFTRIEGIERSF